MSFFGLSISEFICHLKSNVVSAIVMAIVAITVVSFVSIYSYQNSKLRPFDELNMEKGFVLECGYGDIAINNLDKVKNIYTLYASSIESNNEFINAIGYNEWVWNNWQCRLLDGEWFDEAETGEKIPVVIIDRENRYKVDDIIDMSFMFSENYESKSNQKPQGQVVGIADSDAFIFLKNDYYAGDQSFSSFYKTASEYMNGGTIIIFPMEKVSDTSCLIGNVPNMAIFEYENDISDAVYNDNNAYLMNNSGYSGMEYDEFIKLSKDELNQLLITYLPITVTGFIVAIIGTYTMGYLTSERSVKHLVVYSLLGASKKKIIVMMFGNAFGTTMLSLMFFAVGIVAVNEFSSQNNILFMWSGASLISMMLIYAFYLVFMTLILIKSINKKSNRQLLTVFSK